MDLLSSVLRHFSLNASVFFTGNICGLTSFDEVDKGAGHLHLLRGGKLTVHGDKGFKQHYSTPSVIFFPRPSRHSLVADETHGADLVCATINYESGQNSPLLDALPYFLAFDLHSTGILGQSANWIFEEGFEERTGKQLIIDRLCDIFMINILRKLLAEGGIESGMMAGLAHPQLSKVLVKLHSQPEQNWSLNSMADVCAMSRSKFADVFKQVVQQTPVDYLTDWRISVAKKLILQHHGMDLVANQVGYENGSALARVFRKKTGQSPREWLASQRI